MPAEIVFPEKEKDRQGERGVVAHVRQRIPNVLDAEGWMGARMGIGSSASSSTGTRSLVTSPLPLHPQDANKRGRQTVRAFASVPRASYQIRGIRALHHRSLSDIYPLLVKQDQVMDPPTLLLSSFLSTSILATVMADVRYVRKPAFGELLACGQNLPVYSLVYLMSAYLSLLL